MRRILIVLTLLIALLAAPAAIGVTTKTVQIKRDAFAPATVSIVAGDTIRWRNADTRNHQIVSTTGAFASPILRPNRSFSFTFQVAGTYRYRDALNPKVTGIVRVAGPPPSISLVTSAPQIGYGTKVTLTGQVNSRRTGEQVQIVHQPYGQPSPIVLATVVTGTDGIFGLTVVPKILTNYQALWKTTQSLVVTTAVAPTISFGRLNGFVTRVYSGRSMARKQVQLQRRSRFGQWVTIKRVTLDLNSRARFGAVLPLGVSRLRIAMSVNQAGAGYLAAFSREISYRRTK